MNAVDYPVCFEQRVVLFRTISVNIIFYSYLWYITTVCAMLCAKAKQNVAFCADLVDNSQHSQMLYFTFEASLV